MFWVGFCAGAGGCFVLACAGISAIAWSIGKSNLKSSKLHGYWEESIANTGRSADALERICEIIKEKENRNYGN